MTSTYDGLGSLYYRAKETPEIRELVDILYDYAIGEISKVNPKILNWETWYQKNGEKLRKLYGGEQCIDLFIKADFLSDAHSLLDHNTKYHLKTVNRRLDYIISRFRDWFCTYKDRESIDRFYGVTDFKSDTIKRYPKIFKELKHLVDTGFIKLDWLDKRRRKKVEKWG